MFKEGDLITSRYEFHNVLYDWREGCFFPDYERTFDFTDVLIVLGNTEFRLSKNHSAKASIVLCKLGIGYVRQEDFMTCNELDRIINDVEHV